MVQFSCLCAFIVLNIIYYTDGRSKELIRREKLHRHSIVNEYDINTSNRKVDGLEELVKQQRNNKGIFSEHRHKPPSNGQNGSNPTKRKKQNQRNNQFSNVSTNRTKDIPQNASQNLVKNVVNTNDNQHEEFKRNNDQKKNPINNDQIDISILCTSGNGTKSNNWIITETIFYTAIGLLSETVRSIYFRSGYYYSSSPIHIDFGTILSSNSVIRTGVRIYGHYSYWNFADNHSTQPSLHIEWINNATNPASISLFYWEFSGLAINGNALYELLKIGCNDINGCPLNSFVFDLVVSNNYHTMNDDNIYSTAVGIHIIRALQSKIKLVATCVQGTAVYLDNAQFCDIFGSFSNGLTTDGNSIYLNGICLLLENAVSLSFSSVNIENCYNGIYFKDYSYGNVWNSLISNNEDNRGYIITLMNNKYPNITNIIEYLIIRTAIQGNGSYPKLWPFDYSDHIKINYMTQR